MTNTTSILVLCQGLPVPATDLGTKACLAGRCLVVGDRWHVDETYVRVGGEWGYVYRAVDQYGKVIDVFVSPRRDASAAKTFSATRSRRTGPSRPR
jgi:transposase-like protein